MWVSKTREQYDMATLTHFYVFPSPACLAGTYQSNSGKMDCDSCDAGTFSTDGQSVCTQCTEGKFQSLTKQNSCDACSAGKYQDQRGRTECKGMEAKMGWWRERERERAG